ncbi:MAG TPA: anthranilate phosphoribosyltransferase [Acidimicrobiales bacterium]|jgi:anthranilate phosphoribosyltransferase|nr:anthranilate phosphoribosyltransferase [Acidimicrobiales bacterium]
MALQDHGGWPGVLRPVVDGHDLSADAAAAAMGAILNGEASGAQIAAFIVALRMKGETVDEMAGMVRAMLDAATPLELDADVIDIVGTGGSPSRRGAALNVSTMACFVAAGAGAVVCKHGNRAASSTSGSFDLLEMLGLPMDLDAAGVARCVREARVGFAFARAFHPAMRHAAPVRAEIGIPTVFNLLGPLAHPGHVRRQVLGVADPSMAERMVRVLAATGSVHSMVVSGPGNLDELSTTGLSTVHHWHDGELHHYELAPEDVGLRRASMGDLVGGNSATNAAIARSVLRGDPGPMRDIVVLNAAAGLVVADVVDDLAVGVTRAQASIDSGAAQAALDTLLAVSRA